VCRVFRRNRSGTWRLRALSIHSFSLQTGLSPGLSQARNTNPGFGQGAEGYGKRFGAAALDSADGTLWGNAILPILFKEDPRYFRLGSGPSPIAFSTPQPPPFGVGATMVHGDQTTRMRWATSYPGASQTPIILPRIEALGKQ
jgi:hypothetical protein